MENYNKTYAGLFHPIPDSQTWAEYTGPMIFPPDVRRPAGHPPSVCIRTTMDEGCESYTCNRCRNCKHLYHNIARCRNQPAPSSFTEQVCV